MNRGTFEAAKLEATRRGMTFAGFVEFAFAAIGVAIVAHPQQTPELAQMAAARRAESVARRDGKSTAVTDVCGFQ